MIDLLNIFSKKRKIIINFVDSDTKNQIITSKTFFCKKGKKINIDLISIIDELQNHGYQIPASFDRKMAVTVGKKANSVNISVSHQKKIIDVNHITKNFPLNQVKRTIKQIVHYSGAGSRTPIDNVNSAEFYRTLEVDAVTKEIVSKTTWISDTNTFLKIGVPTLPGYVPDKTTVGGKKIVPDDGNQEYFVKYKLNEHPSTNKQAAIIQYVNLTANNAIVKTTKLEGEPNFPINYDINDDLNDLIARGFKLVDNGFNGKGIQFFGNNDSYVPVFIVTLRRDEIIVDSAHPYQKVNPEEYQKDITFTIKFDGAGKKTPENIIKTKHLQRKVLFSLVLNKIVENNTYPTEWKTIQKDFPNKIQVPVVKGYHSNLSHIETENINNSKSEIKVSYIRNNKIIPVDENGELIPTKGTLYLETDPNDPTKLNTKQIIPQIPGYRSNYKIITLSNSNKDIKVIYQKIANNFEKDQSNTYVPSSNNDQIAIVNFIDLDNEGQQITSSGPLIGKPNENITDLYSTSIPLAGLEKAGYHVIFNNFDGNNKIQKFDGNDLTTQVFTVGVSKNSEQNMQLQQLKSSVNELVSQNSNNLSNPVVANLMNVLKSLIDLISILNKDNKNKN